MRGRQEKRSDLRLRFLRHVGEVIGLFAVKGAGNAESFDRLEYGSLDSLLASTHVIQCLGKSLGHPTCCTDSGLDAADKLLVLNSTSNSNSKILHGFGSRWGLLESAEELMKPTSLTW